MKITPEKLTSLVKKCTDIPMEEYLALLLFESGWTEEDIQKWAAQNKQLNSFVVINMWNNYRDIRNSFPGDDVIQYIKQKLIDNLLALKEFAEILRIKI